MGQPTPSQIAYIAEFLRGSRSDLKLNDVMELAERMANALDDTVATVDAILHEEFRTIATEIGALKREMAALRPDHLRFERLPEAGRELDAVVESTEEASGAIMTAAEEIMSADASDPVAYKAFVDERMIVIFEACAFQDLTGQRIRKVVQALTYIEQRVISLGTLWQTKVDMSGVAAPTVDNRNDSHLLNGPAHDGLGQHDIDSMMGGSPAKPSPASQDDIDALFN